MAAALLVPLALFGMTSEAMANTYTRGDIICNDFQKAEDKYEFDPSRGYAVAYAGCLLTKGEDDVRALNILEVEATSRNQVPAARLMALYTASGGTMKRNELNEDNYNEAFQAWGQVIHLIHQHPDYPENFMITELRQQHELEAYFYLVYIPYFKFLAGLNGTNNSHMLQSPTYHGDRNLDLYPKYSPYTLISLEQTIENARICANLPQKNYFWAVLFQQTKNYCRIMGEYAKELLDLEKERLALFDEPSCTRDVKQCSEYQELLYNSMEPLINKKEQQANSVWSKQINMK